MKLIRIMFFVIIPMVFLALGIHVGILSSGSANPGLASAENGNSPEQSVSRQANGKQQFNLLLVNVSSRSSGAELGSAWMVSYHFSNPKVVNFVPLYPLDKNGSDDLNNYVATNFDLSTTGEISPVFLESLQAMYMVKWDGYLVLDKSEILKAFQYLGGANIGGQNLDQEQMKAILDRVGSQAGSSISDRAALIQNLCSQLATTPDTGSLTAFADFLIAHLTILEHNSGFSIDGLRSLITSPELTCVFPTLPPG